MKHAAKSRKTLHKKLWLSLLAAFIVMGAVGCSGDGDIEKENPSLGIVSESPSDHEEQNTPVEVPEEPETVEDDTPSVETEIETEPEPTQNPTPTPAPVLTPIPAPDTQQSEVSLSVYITETGEKYHTGGCRFLKKSKIEIILEDALARGYEPCGVCNP